MQATIFLAKIEAFFRNAPDLWHVHPGQAQPSVRPSAKSLAVIFRTISIKASITGGKKRGEYAPDVVTSGRPFCHRCGSILQLLEQITLIACSTPPDAAPTRSLLKASNRRSTCTRALSSRTASR